MSNEAKRAAKKWAMGVASALALGCIGWVGKTLIDHDRFIAAQEEWNDARPATLEAVISVHEKNINAHIDQRFDRLEDMLQSHINKTP